MNPSMPNKRDNPAILPQRLSTWALVFLIVAATFLTYSPLGRHSFLSLDDGVYVVANPYVLGGVSWGNIRWAVSTFRAEFWHPLTWLSYMVDTELYGARPGGYLFTNLLLHIFNTVLVFYLFRSFFQKVWAGAFVAALFALHPLHVEAVAWISERKELLAAFFWLLALQAYWFYSKSPGLRGWRPYLLVVTGFILGFMAKSMIITLPFLLIVLDYWPLQRDRLRANAEETNGKKTNHSSPRIWLALILEKAPLFGLMIVGIIITLTARKAGGGVEPLSDNPLLTRSCNALLAYTLYIKNTLWPTALTVFYPVDPHINGIKVFLSGIFLGALSIVFWRISAHHRFFAAGWLWFLGTLVPVIGFVSFSDVFMADRFMYMPILGLFMIMAGGILLLVKRLPNSDVWAGIVSLVIIGSYVPATSSQIQVWQNSVTLYAHALKVNPNNYLAHHAMGELYAKRGDWRKAIIHFGQAVNARPDKAAFWVKLGRVLVAEGNWRQARQCFSQAAALAPDHPKPRFYLGCVAVFDGDIPAAIEHLSFCLKKVQEEQPSDQEGSCQADYYYLKGVTYDKDSQKQAAMQCFQKSLTVAPGYFPAVKALTQIYQEAGATEALLALYGVSGVPPRSLIIIGYERWETDMLQLTTT